VAQDPAALIGSVFAEKYRLVSVLGAGGFAVVYGAQHLHLPDLRFAIKLLKRVHLDDPLVLARFEREAKTIAGLRSRYTVRVVDSGVFRNEQPYIVMEYVEGQSLRGVLDGYGPLTPLQTAHMMIGVLRAVDEAHSRGIVHRDLKPENIVVDWDKEENTPLPRVLDFGIAKVVDGEAAGASTATSTGVTMCTPRYAAPEVLFRSAVPASDLYAIGLIIHELLTGRDPYDAATPYDYARRHVEPAPVPLDPVVADGPLGAIVRRACMKAPEDRYPSAASMLDDVRAVFEQIKASVDDPRRELALLAAWTIGATVVGNDPFAGSVAFEPTVGIEEAARDSARANATLAEDGNPGATRAVDGSSAEPARALRAGRRRARRRGDHRDRCWRDRCRHANESAGVGGRRAGCAASVCAADAEARRRRNTSARRARRARRRRRGQRRDRARCGD
jgi:serine/threonine-protein kinase